MQLALCPDVLCPGNLVEFRQSRKHSTEDVVEPGRMNSKHEAREPRDAEASCNVQKNHTSPFIKRRLKELLCRAQQAPSSAIRIPCRGPLPKREMWVIISRRNVIACSVACDLKHETKRNRVIRKGIHAKCFWPSANYVPR